MFDKILERIVVDRRYVPRSDSELVVHTFLGVCGDVFDIEIEDVLLVVAEMLKCNLSLRGSLTLIYFLKLQLSSLMLKSPTEHRCPV